MPGIEYLPASAITPKVGMALTQTTGQLALATGATAPTYISMCEKDGECTAGDIIPVIRVGKDMILETTFAAAATSIKLGDKVTLLGRFQSRAYQKQLPDGTVIGKTAYEVSVGRLTMADAAPQPAPFVIHPEETHTVETLVQPSTPVQVNPFTTPTT